MNVFDNISVNEHVVAESSLLKATGCGHIFSLKAHEAIDNGSIVAKGTFVEEQVWDSKDYAAGDQPLLVLSVPFGYNSDKKYMSQEKYFYNAQNEIMRAYELYKGDIFTVSANAITKINGATDITVGSFVTVSDGLYQEVAADSAPAEGAGFVGKIIEKVTYSNSVSYRILVEDLYK